MDRRSFLKTSGLVGTAAALAPKELLAGASASETAYPVGDTCPKALSALGISASSLITHLVCSGYYKPSDIAYVPMKKETVAILFRDLPEEVLMRDGHVPPYFATLHSILYRKLIQGRDYRERLLGSGDMTMFLASMPRYHEAAGKIMDHNKERMRCGSIREISEIYHQVSFANRGDVVDSYNHFRLENALVDQVDLLIRSLITEEDAEGVKVLIYHTQTPPLWYAALKKFFRKTDQVIFLNGEE